MSIVDKLPLTKPRKSSPLPFERAAAPFDATCTEQRQCYFKESSPLPFERAAAPFDATCTEQRQCYIKAVHYRCLIKKQIFLCCNVYSNHFQ